MSEELSLQTPDLAFAMASANGELAGVDWVEARLDADAPDYVLRRDEGGAVRLRGMGLARNLPPPIAEAAQRVQAQGQPTAWEGLSLLIARAEWLVASRGLLWTPNSPVPALLARLVEAWGVPAEIHRHDPERLRRLAALLPAWRPYSGTAPRAEEVLQAASQQGQAQGRSGDDAAQKHLTDGEVFVVHDYGFWRRRQRGADAPTLQISGGVLCMRPAVNTSPLSRRREDVTVRLGPEAGRFRYRLLPVWTVPRLSPKTTGVSQPEEQTP